MTILLSPLSGVAPDRKEVAASLETGNSGSAPASAAPRKLSSEIPAVTPAQSVPDRSANVTFRRDASGRIYYVLTDAQSGKELQELPPEEVRKVGEGIAQFLKQEEAKNTSHLNVKA
jgi:hypothetical protein